MLLKKRMICVFKEGEKDDTESAVYKKNLEHKIDRVLSI